ncbi:asparagine synthase (glutamine-hydrolyzing) [Microvirga lotononidis]|uniref:asparagine synthase (glutamine-hydrolyzing) n=1 Tax=Microvirga lotononidis TaxID=864069 RepID=I4YYA6_9HYPH|nr:asparagine synthase (glutamine-hydrolyzing) [Microvirga lotononidis]EIM28948.1 asparagine synthase, glutamine-hydrolyzing [Microvirga lotononidis]WQO26866.1 asparagine synthase (glutamine-hydrolyzing) [Microvirga lotononidis]
MCGIVGFLFLPRHGRMEPGKLLERMTSSLVTRGPDDHGEWIDSSAGVALGHRRLSVIDLSPAGHQPMISQSGRYVLVFNGEIYNHKDIRKSLEEVGEGGYFPHRGDDRSAGSRAWRGGSDTETLLAAIERWGVRQALERCVGMFAFGLWDRQERVLTLARDRMGEKPLYYGHTNGMFVFASELKAFQTIPGFNPTINSTALWQYFYQRAIPAPHSIYDGIFKLEPGQLLTLEMTGSQPLGEVKTEYYWSLQTALSGEPFRGTAEDAADELRRILTEAVRMQMIADVPVGAFLSGGIDSSTIVALMQSVSSRKVQSYTIGFEEAGFNEAHHARAVAECLGTDHHELTVTPSEALAVVPHLAEIWDEPFGDSSQVPTAVLSRMTRENVTVALSGDGGDELFCGYKRQHTAAAIERIPGKPLFGALLFAFNSPSAIMRLRALPVGRSSKAAANRLGALAEMFALDSPAHRYMAFSFRPDYWSSLLNQASNYHIGASTFPVSDARDRLTLVSAMDAVTYLPTDILTKVDRAAMAVSLETRLPLLDHRVVEFAFSLPSSYKVRQGQTKWPLRQILNSFVPNSIIDRPKMGFGVPIGTWLRGPLKSWAADLLFSSDVRDDFLNEKTIKRMWGDHQSGTWNYADHLWRVLMLRSWQACYGR